MTTELSLCGPTVPKRFVIDYLFAGFSQAI